VIISTSSNEQVLKFLTEGINDVKKYHNTDISESEIELFLGKSNFLDIEMVEHSIDMKADEELLDVKKEDVKKWYEQKSNRKLTEKFIKDFNLPKSIGKYISATTDNDIDEILSIKNFPLFLKEKNRIYITNHLFLITLVRIFALNRNYRKFSPILEEVPMLLDEAHDLKKLAALKFTTSFSTFRLKNLLSTLNQSEVKITKKQQELVTDTDKLLDSTMNKYILNVTSDSFIFKKHYDTLKTYFEKYQKNFEKLINKMGDKNDKKVAYIKRYLANEFHELSSIFYIPSKDKINFQYSPKRGYLKASVLKKDPKFELKTNFWYFVGNVSLFSGTLRVSAEDNTAMKNRWSVGRLGLFEHKNATTEKQEKFNIL